MSDDQKTSSCCCSCSSRPVPPEPRRSFFGQLIALVVGFFAFAVPAVLGIFSALNPLRQKGQAGQLFRITSLDVLPEDGTPRKFPVISDLTDAWTIRPDVPIGKVFLRRTEGDKVVAFSDICPHAGCLIDYNSQKKQFFCPCHAAYFQLDGERIGESSPSPRGMDQMPEVEIRDGQIWVKYEKFVVGTTKKIVEI
jgi:quinol---cytochrome c reductase iron-sulfur subunit, bacillus type